MASSSSLSERTWESLANTLWSQWRALGVPASARASSALIDPEALLIETAALTHERTDARIRDGAIAWAAQHHELIATARLKRLLDRRDQAATDAFKLLARQVAGNAGRLSWPMIDAAARWTISIEPRLPKLDDHPSLLRLRTRGMFGANARAEAIAYLTCASGPVELAALERDTLYSRKQLSDALNGLVQASWAIRSHRGKSLRFDLPTSVRHQMRTPMRDMQLHSRSLDATAPPVGPRWIDWNERYQLARLLASTANTLESGDTLGAIASARRADEFFTALSLPAPAPIAAHETNDQVKQRTADWIEHATTRVLDDTQPT